MTFDIACIVSHAAQTTESPEVAVKECAECSTKAEKVFENFTELFMFPEIASAIQAQGLVGRVQVLSLESDPSWGFMTLNNLNQLNGLATDKSITIARGKGSSGIIVRYIDEERNKACDMEPEAKSYMTLLAGFLPGVGMNAFTTDTYFKRTERGVCVHQSSIENESTETVLELILGLQKGRKVC